MCKIAFFVPGELEIPFCGTHSIGGAIWNFSLIPLSLIYRSRLCGTLLGGATRVLYLYPFPVFLLRPKKFCLVLCLKNNCAHWGLLSAQKSFFGRCENKNGNYLSPSTQHASSPWKCSSCLCVAYVYAITVVLVFTYMVSQAIAPPHHRERKIWQSSFLNQKNKSSAPSSIPSVRPMQHFWGNLDFLGWLPAPVMLHPPPTTTCTLRLGSLCLFPGLAGVCDNRCIVLTYGIVMPSHFMYH